MAVRRRTWKSGRQVKTAWVADYFDQAGKRRLKTFTTKRAAEAWLVTTRHQVAQGVHTPEGASLTVAEAAALWIRRAEADHLERSTLNKYRNHVDLHIVPRIGGVKLARLSTPAVESFKDQLVRELSWAMARKVLGSLKAILAEAQRRGVVAQNAALPVRLEAKRREKRKVTPGLGIASKQEVVSILEAADPRWRPLLVTAVFTGMRSSELRGLEWNSVDFDRRTISVRQRADQWGTIGAPKSQAGHRHIPMAPIVVSTLREWRLACPRALEEGGKARLRLVFPNGAGKPESHSNIIHRGFQPALVNAGVTQRYGLHALRHFFASWAIEQGFSPKRLQSLLGHSSIQMTYDVYGHLFPSIEDDHAKFAAAEMALSR